MALDLSRDCRFSGPAFPEPFVRHELEKELSKAGLLKRTTGAEEQALQESWASFRRKLLELAVRGGAIRVRNYVIEPLAGRLGWSKLEDGGEVETREGPEPGGELLVSSDGKDRLRVWSVAFDEDLDAPAQRGAAYRYSWVRIAQRVLLASGERLGLLTNGVQIRLLLSDPARPDSQIEIGLDHWKRSREAPDSYRLLLALASPQGLKALPVLVERARIQQTRVTKELRTQARQAIERFLQQVLDHPENKGKIPSLARPEDLPKALWREGLVLVYRLLVVLKLESTDDLARAFNFASSALWRNTFSPSLALAGQARAVLDQGAETGRFLEDGLRTLFRIFAQGVDASELHVKPLGGALFGEDTTPLLSQLRWGEMAVAHLLDRLLWTERARGGRERVHYGPLDVEDLGRVYEALLELEPGISAEQMCRLRRGKLEVVLPLAQGERYRPAEALPPGEPGEDAEEDTEEEEGEDSPRGAKTKVEWVEEIPPGRFHLRVGLGRKATGAYYTPHSFVRFLVQETLGPQVAERSPKEDPRPLGILKLKVLDPAMGSGHFLVEACRFLGDKLYEACRLCDERALAAERKAEQAKDAAQRQAALAEARDYRQRVIDLPDPDDELLRYLPSRVPEGHESGFSQKRAEALCRRLVAVHCLYGVDKNPLAVELAKVSLWIESHAEGFPLTFLDHRLVLGDSLTGPFFEHLLKYPGTQEPIRDMFTQGLQEKLARALGEALARVKDLELSVGVNLDEVKTKLEAKAGLDRALAPFRVLAAAWAGWVMLGSEGCDDMAYAALARPVAERGDLPERVGQERLRRMIARGLDVPAVKGEKAELLGILAAGASAPGLPFELAFPEVFFPEGDLGKRGGFDSVLGNPPWDAIQFKTKEFFAAFDFEILNAPTKRERTAIEARLIAAPACGPLFVQLKESFEQQKRVNDALYGYQKVQIDGDLAGRYLDAFRVFMERNAQLLGPSGWTGVVVPSAFHANEGATGVRQLYLEKLRMRFCFSFENKLQLFEIHRSFKFALVGASRPGPTESFPCGFYLHEDEWLFGDRKGRELSYSLDFVRQTCGESLAFLEITRPQDHANAATCYASGISLGALWDEEPQTFSTAEVNLTLDRERLVPSTEIGLHAFRFDPRTRDRLLEKGVAFLLEGKALWHFQVIPETESRYVIPLSKLADRPHWRKLICHFRASYRKIASSTNERTMVWGLIPPGPVTCESCPTEQAPWKRANSQAIERVALLNAFVPDYLLRLRVAATVSMFMLRQVPLPRLGKAAQHILSHSGLRLQCNGEEYAPLWREQVGNVWREPKSSFTWPVLATDDERWAVRAAIDAIVADAYGLSRDQYTHVLSTFSHRSYPQAPALCLARFDELKAIGLEAFAKKHDPYWDIPLCQELPKPVIDLPTPVSASSGEQQGDLFGGTSPQPKIRRRASRGSKP